MERQTSRRPAQLQLDLEGREVADHGSGSEAVSGAVGQVAGQVSLAEEGTRAWEQELMERVAEEANLVEALGRVCANKGSAGIDQMSVAELRAWMSQRTHRAELRERLIRGSYQPALVRGVQIPKPGGQGVRQLGIPMGTFRLGSPTNEVGRYSKQGPQTAVTISRGFWMGKYQVTQEDYLSVMGTNPSYFAGDLGSPVEQVRWFDATNYCGQLAQRERAAGRIPTNSVYGLPSEAEWEYACRAWTSTRFGYGDDPGYTNLTNYAWYLGNSNGRTRPVGQKLPSLWGLYDMHGNVWEWCQDWYSPYAGGTALDPQSPATDSIHVIRGGCWSSLASHCRSARRRDGNNLDGNLGGIGFRIVLAPGQP